MLVAPLALVALLVEDLAPGTYVIAGNSYDVGTGAYTLTLEDGSSAFTRTTKISPREGASAPRKPRR